MFYSFFYPCMYNSWGVMELCCDHDIFKVIFSFKLKVQIAQLFNLKSSHIWNRAQWIFFILKHKPTQTAQSPQDSN